MRKINRDIITEAYGRLGKILLVAEELGINEKTVRNALKEMSVPTTARNLRNRKYHVNENFFESIDNPVKAYYLGFVWGDGNITAKAPQLRIELSQDDECILHNFRQVVESNHEIKYRKRIRKNTVTESVTFYIPREKMVKDLVSLGLSYSKNKDLVFPNIPELLYPYFILGLSDSDGCIRIDSLNRVHWSIISTTSICQSIKDILAKSGIQSRVTNTKYENLSRVVITRKSEAIKLRSYMYSDSCIQSLDRKRNAFLSVKYKKGGVG